MSRFAAADARKVIKQDLHNASPQDRSSIIMILANTYMISHECDNQTAVHKAVMLWNRAHPGQAIATDPNRPLEMKLRRQPQHDEKIMALLTPTPYEMERARARAAAQNGVTHVTTKSSTRTSWESPAPNKYTVPQRR